MSAPEPLRPPVWAGKYRITGTLVPGAAYRALDDEDQAVVTLVILPPGSLPPPADDPAPLRHAAGAALGVEERDVRVLGSGEAAGFAYIAIEPLDVDAIRRRAEDDGSVRRSRFLGGVRAAWAEIRKRPALIGAAGAVLLLTGLAGFCGGGPSRLTGSSSYVDLTKRLDALYDAQAAPLAVSAGEYDAPRLAAALDALDRAEPGNASLQALQQLRSEIDAAPTQAQAVCIVDRHGEVVEVRGDGSAATALQEAWQLSRGAGRVLAVFRVPWIGAAAPIRHQDAHHSPAGWVIAGNPLDLEAVRDVAAAHEAVILWRVNGSSYRVGPGDSDVQAIMLLDPIGERAIPGGVESAEFHSVLRSPVRVTSLAVAFLGMLALVAAHRLRGARVR